MQAQDAQVLFQWVLELLRMYSRYNLGQRSVQAAEAVQDAYRSAS